MLKKIESRLNIVLLILLVLGLVFARYRLFLIAVGIVGTVFVAVSAVRAIIKRQITVDLLAAIALFVSVAEREWLSVAFINLMITSARIFGDYTEGVATSAIKGLLKLRPEKVKIKTQEEIKEIPLAEVKLNDLVVVETGDRVAVDGVIIEGEGSLDQSSLTGESIPVSKEKGDKVFSSTLNVSGTMLVKVEKVGADTTFEKIISLIEKAQANKIKIETIGQRFASWYVVVSFIGSLVIYGVSHNLPLVLSVLLVVCADDIAVAIPMAFWAAVGHAARRGIIIKGADMLEGLTKLKTLVMDKTGTLTRGKIKVTGVDSFEKYEPKEVLALMAEAESISEHPIAKAVVDYAESQGIKIKAPDDFNEIPGKGVIVNKGKKRLVAGRLSFIKEQNVKVSKAQELEINSFLNGGSNLVLVAIGTELLGLITFEDAIRPKIRETLEALRRLGIEKFYMLTGDNELVAKRVAREAGIADYKANFLPEDKLNFVKDHLSEQGKLAMVGDGVNDAASLAQADIGIAMGAIGADAAIESADIALMNDDFAKIEEVVTLGKYTLGIAKQNFAIWGLVNVIGLFLVFSGRLNPSGAAAYNFVTDFIPIFNSLRLFVYSRK